MPDSLRTTVDQYAETHGYGGRSEVVRQALRAFCTDSEPDRAAGRQLATFVVCFEYGDARVERQVAAVRRESGCVVAHTHGHAAGCCLDLIVTYGTASQQQTLAAELRAIGGVDRVDQSVTTLPDEKRAATET